MHTVAFGPQKKKGKEKKVGLTFLNSTLFDYEAMMPCFLTLFK